MKRNCYISPQVCGSSAGRKTTTTNLSGSTCTSNKYSQGDAMAKCLSTPLSPSSASGAGTSKTVQLRSHWLCHQLRPAIKYLLALASHVSTHCHYSKKRKQDFVICGIMWCVTFIFITQGNLNSHRPPYTIYMYIHVHVSSRAVPPPRLIYLDQY